MNNPLAIAQTARWQYGALQREGELAQLVELVQTRLPRTILEIGTYRGGTLRAWCESAAEDALLVSVDLPGGEFGGGCPEGALSTLYHCANADQRVVLIRGDSHDAGICQQIVDALEGRQVDFLFIDGDHTYDGVKADFVAYAPLVAEGGLISLHDVVPYPEVPRCQVDRFWSEDIEPAFSDARVIRTAGDYLGCGIGVLTWPGT